MITGRYREDPTLKTSMPPPAFGHVSAVVLNTGKLNKSGFEEAIKAINKEKLPTIVLGQSNLDILQTNMIKVLAQLQPAK